MSLLIRNWTMVLILDGGLDVQMLRKDSLKKLKLLSMSTKALNRLNYLIPTIRAHHILSCHLI